jgi:hypothetical protein
VKTARLILAAAVLITIAVLGVRTTSSSSTAVPPIPCTTSALGEGFEGQYHLASIQNYGCEGRWAFTWATVGRGLYAFGVTEVLNYSATNGWALVSRSLDCKASILPHVIYRQGCFSN